MIVKDDTKATAAWWWKPIKIKPEQDVDFLFQENPWMRNGSAKREKSPGNFGARKRERERREIHSKNVYGKTAFRLSFLRFAGAKKNAEFSGFFFLLHLQSRCRLQDHTMTTWLSAWKADKTATKSFSFANFQLICQFRVRRRYVELFAVEIAELNRFFSTSSRRTPSHGIPFGQMRIIDNITKYLSQKPNESAEFIVY